MLLHQSAGTYDLRRLKRKGLIVRLPGRHRYQLTPLGRRVAVLFTKVYGRVLAPGLAALDPQLPTDLVERSELARAWRQLERRLDRFAENGSPLLNRQTWSDCELRRQQAKLVDAAPVEGVQHSRDELDEHARRCIPNAAVHEHSF